MPNLARNNKNRGWKGRFTTRQKRETEKLLRKCFHFPNVATRDKDYLDFIN